MATKFEMLSKISVKNVCGKPKAPNKGETEMLMQVMGVATGYKVGEANFGPWTSLIGSFQAVNVKTGEIFRSGVLFVPNIVLNAIMPQLNTEGNKAVEFAFNIGIKYDEDAVTSYVYFAEPIFEVADNDPLELITKKLKSLGHDKSATADHKKEEKKRA